MKICLNGTYEKSMFLEKRLAFKSAHDFVSVGEGFKVADKDGANKKTIINQQGQFAAQSVTPDDSEGTGNTILKTSHKVDVGAVTNDANDFIVLPSLADVANGHEITILCNAGTDFELRTPASSAEEINSEDCDGTKEYLCTDTEVLKVIKINDTIGWMAHAYSAIGAVVTAVVPD